MSRHRGEGEGKEIVRVAFKAREKAESEATDMENAWDESNSKEKAKITRVNAEASEKTKAEV